MRKLVEFFFFLLLILLFLNGCNSNEVSKDDEIWEDNSPSFTHEYGEMFGKEGSIGIIGLKRLQKMDKSGCGIFGELMIYLTKNGK